MASVPVFPFGMTSLLVLIPWSPFYNPEYICPSNTSFRPDFSLVFPVWMNQTGFQWHQHIQSDDLEPKLTAYGHSKHKGCCNQNLCRLVQSVDSDCEDPGQPGPKVTCNECKNKVNSIILIHRSTMLIHLNCRVMAEVRGAGFAREFGLSRQR
jgi:hypothetical protein